MHDKVFSLCAPRLKSVEQKKQGWLQPEIRPNFSSSHIHFLLRSLFSFRLARRIGPILPRTHRACRKFLCSCYQLYALVGPPGFVLFTITSTRLDTYLLTYLPILTYLCYSLCPSVCFFCLFLFLKRSGLVLRSCPVSLSPFDFHIESSKCCDPWISGHLILRPLIRCSLGKYSWKNQIEFSC